MKLKKLLFIILPSLFVIGIAILIVFLLNNRNITIYYQSSDPTMGYVSKESEKVKLKKDAIGTKAIYQNGYHFVNWTCDGVEVGTDTTFIPSKTSKNKNVKATYVANFAANKFNTKFYSNYDEGIFFDALEQTYNEYFNIPNNIPTRNGYTFVGWFLDERYAGWFTFNPCCEEINSETKVTICEQDHVNAHWEANKYSVTFNGNESDEAYSETIQETYDLFYILPEVNPVRLGYEFVGWFTDAVDGEEITSETQVSITANQTLYAHWTEACVAEGTLITMKDGSKKAIENIVLGDEILTFDHTTGKLSSSSVCFVWKSELVGNIFTLHFDQNIDVTVIDKHGFYDTDNKEYVFITLDNVGEYVGHHFYNGDLDTVVVLSGFEKVNEKINAYAIVSSVHLNHMANGMLSMCDGTVEFLANLFEFNDDMTFNQEDINKQIDLYGLTSREEFLKYKGWTSQEYDDYNFKYLAIMVGKGYLSWEEVQAYSDLYESLEFLQHNAC